MNTAAEARAAGAPKYFTGKPCKSGHVAERWTLRSVCVQCSRDSVLAIYHRNPEPKKAQIADWGRRNPEKVRAYKRAYKARRRAGGEA